MLTCDYLLDLVDLELFSTAWGECGKPATVRYREKNATYPWLGRCAEHEGALSREHCDIEPLS